MSLPFKVTLHASINQKRTILNFWKRWFVLLSNSFDSDFPFATIRMKSYFIHFLWKYFNDKETLKMKFTDDLRRKRSFLRCLKIRRPYQMEILLLEGKNHKSELWTYGLLFSQRESSLHPGSPYNLLIWYISKWLHLLKHQFLQQ